MSKMTIDWHIKCLENSEESLKLLVQQITSMTEEMKRQRKQNTFKKKQISAALQKGKDGFDDELFMKKEKMEFMDR